MSNDRADFAPEVRASGWWSGDSRMAAQGRANEAVMQKLGLMERPDLSDVEAVQMGHVMQPVIGRLASVKLGIELQDLDAALSHPTETWLKSHFDFVSTDGKVLVEAKNYGSHARSKFDSDAGIIPAADMAQLIHECTVHGAEKAVLAVLFGGQEFLTFSYTITQAQKEDFIKEMSVFWGHVKTGQPLAPETVEQAKTLFKTDTGTSVTATLETERIALALRQTKDAIKQLESQEEELQTALMARMQNHSELVTVDGRILATWKQAKASKGFDAKLFQSAMPDIYQQFVTEKPGSRRFLVK